MIELTELSKHYSKLSVFTALSFSFSECAPPPNTDSHTNNRHCIVGPNGSGKSTLLCIIAGLITPDTGQVLKDGKALIAKQVAIASDAISFPGFLKAQDVLALTQSLYSCKWPEQHIARFAFAPHLQKRVDALSAGNLKKLQLINALMRETPVLLVDEPNIALDEASVAYMWDVFLQYEGTLLAASNEPELFTSRGYQLHDLAKQSVG